MYLCYEKYGMQQVVEIGLSSRVIYSEYSSSARREKPNFSPLLHNIRFYSTCTISAVFHAYETGL